MKYNLRKRVSILYIDPELIKQKVENSHPLIAILKCTNDWLSILFWGSFCSAMNGFNKDLTDINDRSWSVLLRLGVVE